MNESRSGRRGGCGYWALGTRLNTLIRWDASSCPLWVGCRGSVQCEACEGKWEKGPQKGRLDGARVQGFCQGSPRMICQTPFLFLESLNDGTNLAAQGPAYQGPAPWKTVN